jgi:hypothetical protein
MGLVIRVIIWAFVRIKENGPAAPKLGEGSDPDHMGISCG